MKQFSQRRVLFARSTSSPYLRFALPTAIALALLQAGHAVSAQPEVVEPADNAALIERLGNTNLLIGVEIYDQLNLVRSKSMTKPSRHSSHSRVFSSANPYEPRYQKDFERFEDIDELLPRNTRSYRVDESKGQITFFGQAPVMAWYVTKPTNTQVCAVRFTDSNRTDYELRTFATPEKAIANDYVITHRYHCGTCSSLRNLAVYMAKPDLTTPARSCARKLTLRGIKRCLIEDIGFEAQCAETWAYNVAHTKRRCMTTCVKHYGVWRVLRNDMGDAHIGSNGELNPCLACDEYISGPGFQYTAGRTRRSSGLVSAIQRSAAEVFRVDHRLYFE